jgi:chromate reductase, NAD(P)H dehydrogenase (quinone)
MGQPIKILALSGSARRESFNSKLVKVAAEGAIAAGATVTQLNFRDYPMPIFDEDLEAETGLPKTVLQFKALLKDHQGLLLACPEYNSSITPLLKNALDWASRPEPGESPMALSCFRGKVAALLSASPGGLGGLRGLIHVRDILGELGMIVIPEQKSISAAYEAFDESGNLKEERQRQEVQAIAAQLVKVTAKLIETTD